MSNSLNIVRLILICCGIVIIYLVINDHKEREQAVYDALMEEQLFALRVEQLQDELKELHPEEDIGCIIVASYIHLDRFEEVRHMMQPFGRCATKILGIRVDIKEHRFK